MIIKMRDPGLTEKEMRAAEVMASNEINEVMADLEIVEEQLDQTYLFKGLPLQRYAIQHLQDKPRNKDGTNFSEEVLTDLYRYYFGPSQKGNAE